MAYLDQSRWSLSGAYLRARFDVDRLNTQGLAELENLGFDELTHRMRAGVDPWGAGALYGCRVALIECVIHQLDIRRSIELRRDTPADSVRVALTFARSSPVIRTIRGVRWVATDIAWAAGRGLEVRGSAEALLLAMTGRVSAVADELDGAGVALLR